MKSVMKRLYHFEKDPDDEDGSSEESKSVSDQSINRERGGVQVTKSSDIRRKSFSSNLIDQFMRVLG